jgi:hypothetical protein
MSKRAGAAPGVLLCALLLYAAAPLWSAQSEGASVGTQRERVQAVLQVPGLAAFWDFVARDQEGRFVAYTSAKWDRAYPLEAVNYVRDYWNEGRPASYADFPLLNQGPFGQGVVFRRESDPTFRPTLLLRREHFHQQALDVNGPGRSVSMLAWLAYQDGDHAVAGIWHEGTDLQFQGQSASKVEAGKRQYALFAGLAGNRGAAAVHVSENGRASFGDRYARNLAVTPQRIPAASPDADEAAIHAQWSVVGFVFDNERDRVTAYLNGIAEDYWIEENLFDHPFFKWPANAWKQAQLHRIPGVQDGEDVNFPPDQFYTPPEDTPIEERLISDSGTIRVRELLYEFTKVRVTERKKPEGGREPLSRELIALRANPFWFPHDLFTPESAADGGHLPSGE